MLHECLNFLELTLKVPKRIANKKLVFILYFDFEAAKYTVNMLALPFSFTIQRSKYKTRNQSKHAMDGQAHSRASISKQKVF